MSWCSPLKPKGKAKDKKKEEEELFKPVKCKIPKGVAKAIVKADYMDSVGADWVERWIENWVQGNCMPPQLLSGEFLGLLRRFLGAGKADEVLEAIRKEYANTFGGEPEVEEEE